MWDYNKDIFRHKGLRRLLQKEFGNALSGSVQIGREINQEDAARYMGHVSVIK